MCTLSIGKKNRTTETKERIIGNCHSFLISGEFVHGRDWAEELLVERLRIHWEIGQNRRGVGGTGIGKHTASAHCCAMRRSLFNLLSQAFSCLACGHWAVLRWI